MSAESAAGAAVSGLAPAEPDEVVDVDSPPWQGEPWPLLPGEPLGQTFRARHDGLCAVEFLLRVTGAASGDLTCHLHADGPDGPWLVSVRRAAADLPGERFARFALPPLAASAGQRYYAWLEAAAAGLAVYTAGPTQLGDGAAYRGHAPVAGCLVFRTFAAGADARFADRRQIEVLLAAQADLTRQLVAARQELQRLTDERALIERRLAALFARLTSSQPAGAPDA
jgi:hypothetical protein